MYTIWVLALSLGIVTADIGLGYHYKVPETSYGVPSYQTGGSGYNTGYSGTTSTNTGNAGSATAGAVLTGNSNSAFATTSGIGTGFNYNTQGSGTKYNYNVQGGSTNQGAYQGSFGQNTQSVLDGYYQGGAGIVGTQSSQVSGSGVYNQYQPSNQYQTAAFNKYQEYYNQIVHQPPQVFKHFYVHAAPEEPEIPKPRQPLVLPPPQKHYKIIFIKTPAQQAPAPQLIPVPQQNEEKTIVYVLVKKPEDAQNIVLPKFEQKAPTKPEVFFIKYNDKQDSQAVINNIVNDYNQGSASTTFSGAGTGYTAGLKETGSSGSSGVASAVSSSGFGSSAAVSGNGAVETSYSGVSEGAYGTASGFENQAGSFGTQFTSGPTVVTTSAVDTNSFGSGLESIFKNPESGVSSSTASSVSSLGYEASAISTSQGVPHETYGLPKFREY